MRLLVSLLACLTLLGCSGSNNPSDDPDMPSNDAGTDDITSNSYIGILESSLDLLRGQYYQRLMIVVSSGEDVWGAPLSQPSGNPTTGSCPGGGSFSREESYTENNGGPVPVNAIELTLSDCDLNGTVINGTLTLNLATESSRQGTTLTQEIALNNITIINGSLSETVSATLMQSAGTFGFQQFYDIDFQTSSYVRISGDNRLELRSANYQQNYNHEQDTQGATTTHSFAESGSGVLQLDGDVNLRGTLTMFPALVHANESPENTANWMHTDNLASGLLEITAIDGSNIQISPDTGNIDTVNYAISSNGFQTLVEDFWFAPAASSQLP